jgi:hypothetical protein
VGKVETASREYGDGADLQLAVAPTRANHAAGREKRDQAGYSPIDTTGRSLGKKLIRSLDICF